MENKQLRSGGKIASQETSEAAVTKVLRESDGDLGQVGGASDEKCLDSAHVISKETHTNF